MFENKKLPAFLRSLKQQERQEQHYSSFELELLCRRENLTSLKLDTSTHTKTHQL